jgi:DNA gyrase subunit A
VTLIRLGDGESLQAIERVDASLEDEADGAASDAGDAAMAVEQAPPAT